MARNLDNEPAWNVIADGWTNGDACLLYNVNKRTAEYYAGIYRFRYENRPFPNGEGVYPYKNFRVILMPECPKGGWCPLQGFCEGCHRVKK